MCFVMSASAFREFGSSGKRGSSAAIISTSGSLEGYRGGSFIKSSVLVIPIVFPFPCSPLCSLFGHGDIGGEGKTSGIIRGCERQLEIGGSVRSESKEDCSAAIGGLEVSMVGLKLW